MTCRSVFQIVVLAALLIGIVACQEETQESAAGVALEEPVAVEPEPEADIKEETGDPDDEIVVSYGDKKLTMRKVEYLQPKADDKTIKEMADWWINTQLLYEEAEKRGVTEDPAAQLRANLMAKRAYAEVLNRNVQNAVEVTEVQMLDYYAKNKESDPRIKQPATMSFSHVTSDTVEKAAEVLDKVRAGADISALAKEVSVDYDAKRGGVVKKAAENNIARRFGKAFSDALLAASVGEVIGPIKSQAARGKAERYEVARLETKEQARIKSFEEVKDYIKSKLERPAKRDALKNLHKSLEEKAAGKIYRSERILKEEAAQENEAQRARRIRPGGRG